MSLSTREVRVNGNVYEVREQPMRVLLPILEGDTRGAMVELMRASVYEAGEPLGDAVMDLGFRAFTPLMTAVKELHGIGEETAEDASGNAA